MRVTIENDSVFRIELEGSVELCSVVVNVVFDFTGVADRPPRGPGKVMAAPAPVKETPPALKEKLDASPRGIHYWTGKREDVLRDNFFKIGAQGIFDEGLLPGFALEEILIHCEELGLFEKMRRPKGDVVKADA